MEQQDDIRGSLSSAGNSGQDGCAFAAKKKKGGKEELESVIQNIDSTEKVIICHLSGQMMHWAAVCSCSETNTLSLVSREKFC